MKTYQATVERDGLYWVIQVEGVGPTQARRWRREVDIMTRDLIAIMTDDAPDSFDVDYEFR